MLTQADQGNISYQLAALWRLVTVVCWAEAYRCASPVPQRSDESLRWCLDSLPDVNALCINIEWQSEWWGLNWPELVISTLKGGNHTHSHFEGCLETLKSLWIKGIFIYFFFVELSNANWAELVSLNSLKLSRENNKTYPVYDPRQKKLNFLYK